MMNPVASFRVSNQHLPSLDGRAVIIPFLIPPPLAGGGRRGLRVGLKQPVKPPPLRLLSGQAYPSPVKGEGIIWFLKFNLILPLHAQRRYRLTRYYKIH